MTEWVAIFCIVASVFAIATLIYVVGSIINGITRKAEERRVYSRANKSAFRTERVLLITGLLCAASGLLLGHVITRDREKSAGADAKSPFKR